MNRSLYCLTLASAVWLVTTAGRAQEVVRGAPAAEAAPPKRSATELEQLAAPIALYPDPLLAVILPAAVYPVEIVQAARFVANPDNLPNLAAQPWDENVKAVAKIPAIIKMMNDDLGWTVELGQAFLNQSGELMDSIQALRAQAQVAGTLQTSPQQVVTVTNAVVERYYETQIVYVTNTVVQIVPANPEVIYVPVYNPTVIYAPPATTVYSSESVVTFGFGMAVGSLLVDNHCDWYYGNVYSGPSRVGIWGGSGSGHYPYYPPPLGCRPPPYYRPPANYRPPPPGYRPPGYPPPVYYPTKPPVNTGSRPPPPATQLPATAQRWQPDQNRIRSTGVNSTESHGWSSSKKTPPPQVIRGANYQPVTPPPAQPSSPVIRGTPKATQGRSDSSNHRQIPPVVAPGESALGRPVSSVNTLESSERGSKSRDAAVQSGGQK